MSLVYPSLEDLPLKRPHIGPPDVYPQSKKQKEDELTPQCVKHGFQNQPVVSNEHASALRDNVDASAIASSLSAILEKKIENSLLPEVGKKKSSINHKDNFMLIATKNKTACEQWFRDLADNKSLLILSKKVPIIKKEDVFTHLCDYNVPIHRAVWFIKMSAAYSQAVAETRFKRRSQVTDSSIEWTIAITRFMKEQLIRSGTLLPASSSSSASSSGGATSSAGASPFHTPSHFSGGGRDEEGAGGGGTGWGAGAVGAGAAGAASKLWQYCEKVSACMYEDGLLDRQEFLGWLVELLEHHAKTTGSHQPRSGCVSSGSSCSAEDNNLRLLLGTVFKYHRTIATQYLLARRMADFCCKRVVYMLHQAGFNERPSSPPLSPQSQLASAQEILRTYMGCAQHRAIILQISCCIQVITYRCPSALVYMDLGGKSGPFISHGSPLDVLPLAPHSLPMPEDCDHCRPDISSKEKDIVRRGVAADARWSSEKVHQSKAGFVTGKLLEVLDILDHWEFDRTEDSTTTRSLYEAVFNTWSQGQADDSDQEEEADPTMKDQPVVVLLCEWAITCERTGSHRASVSAKLIEMRQTCLTAAARSDQRFRTAGSTPVQIPSPSTLNATSANSSTETAPVSAVTIPAGDGVTANGTEGSLDESMNGLPSLVDGDGSPMETEAPPLFQQLLLGFLDTKSPTLDDSDCATTRRKFMNLVSLFGEFIRLQVFSHDLYVCTLIARGNLTQQTAPSQHAQGAGPHSQVSSSGDWPPGSVMSVGDGLDEYTGGLGSSTAGVPGSAEVKQQGGRHMQYLTHFTLTCTEEGEESEDVWGHELNQRLVTLYGVTRERDTAKHAVRKVTRDLVKLFGKKSCIVVGSQDGGRVKVKKGGELDTLLARFLLLSYHDRYAVATATCDQVVELYSQFARGQSDLLPAIDHLSFLFELMETSLYINVIIKHLIRILREIEGVNKQIGDLEGKSLVHYNRYPGQVAMYSIGVFRLHLPSLLLEPENCGAVFSSLMLLVQKVRVASQCYTHERCILIFLYDLYNASTFFREQASFEYFSSLGCDSKIKESLCVPPDPKVTVSRWEKGHFTRNFSESSTLNAKLTFFDAGLVRRLGDSLYTFIADAITYACLHAQSVEEVTDLGVFCAECASHCNNLCSDWLGALQALAATSLEHKGHYSDLARHISLPAMVNQGVCGDDTGEVSSMTARLDRLYVLVAVLIARQIISLEAFIVHVALPVLYRTQQLSMKSSDSECGAKLVCHLVRRLLKSASSLEQGSAQRYENMRSAGDLLLLEAAREAVQPGPLLHMLKILLLLAEDCLGDKTSMKRGDGITDVFDDEDLDTGISSDSSMRPGSLERTAKWALVDICKEEWVKEKFLRDPEKLMEPKKCSATSVPDTTLQPYMTWYLVELVCRRPDEVLYDPQDYNDHTRQQEIITKILKRLDRWSLRVACLELKLMYNRQPLPLFSEKSLLLDNIARATIEVFQSHTEVGPTPGSSQSCSSEAVWLVAPLISRLPVDVQGRVLSSAGLVLENSNKLWYQTGSDEEKERSMSLLNHQPFLSLVLTCLRGKEEQRTEFIGQLEPQFAIFIEKAKENKLPTDLKLRRIMKDSLQLRLSLVGGIFATLKERLTQDWAQMFMRLIVYGVVTPLGTKELFTTVLDMLSALLHGTLVYDSTNGGEEKKYQSTTKRLKKEMGDRRSPGIDLARQLLPLPKVMLEIVTSDSYGSVFDSKGNKVGGPPSGAAKKDGLQATGKVKVNPWDMIDGLKNISPLSWTWYSTRREEQKPLLYEEQLRMLLHHSDHSFPKKPESYFLEPVDLPLEDISDKVPEEKPAASTAVTSSGTATDISTEPKTAKKVANRKKSKRQSTTATAASGAGMGPGLSGPAQRKGPAGGMAGVPSAASRVWGYEGVPQQSSTKLALSNHIQRHQGQGQPPPYNMQPGAVQGSMQPGQGRMHNQQVLLQQQQQQKAAAAARGYSPYGGAVRSYAGAAGGGHPYQQRMVGPTYMQQSDGMRAAPGAGYGPGNGGMMGNSGAMMGQPSGYHPMGGTAGGAVGMTRGAPGGAQYAQSMAPQHPGAAVGSMGAGQGYGQPLPHQGMMGQYAVRGQTNQGAPPPQYQPYTQQRY